MNDQHVSAALQVRPILHTAHTDAYLTILRAAGMQVLSRSDGWTLLQGGSGRLALHRLYDGVFEGQTALGFEVADLEAYAVQARGRAPSGLRVEVGDADHGRAVRVTGRDGLEFTIDQAEQPDVPVTADPAVVVHQLWVSTDVARTAEDLVALGCRKRLTETNGRTIDVDADLGRVLVHVADNGVVAADSALDYDGDLEQVHVALLNAGVRHDVIDESHGRTLKVPKPGTDGDPMWITHEDEDPAGSIRH
ncbi:hypothetical protein [Leekyejoonella antrihumi]|uniref:Uncharacterized protein n=1 Tax=Leekyejoonella antrihumi TaxID=1660198 RepID=A0A563E208_9MICO|nr:hypothetical protein [Leekyejoonella antrihumi]TWP36222.1 hypothetical protein FGL98_11030 [Leekyejoonella antrihumi]